MLWVVAGLWAAIGLGFLLRPVLLGEYVNLFLPTTTARIHLRASHGGLALALAVYFWQAGVRPAWRDPGLALCLLVHAGLALATALGIAVEGRTIPRIGVMLGMELLVAAWAARSLSARQAR
jgi:Domain of unknown function (DUF4345)